MITQHMNRIHLRHLGCGALLLAALLLGGCSNDSEPVPAAQSEEAEPEHDEHAEETGRVELTEAAMQNAGIAVAEVSMREITSGSGSAAAPGQVELDPARVTLISPRTSGRIERLVAVEGDAVRGGQAVAYVLSHAFLTAQNDFIQAVRRAELLAGTPDETGANALAEAAGRRLDLLGASDQLIERLATGGAALDLLPIVAPFSGSIIEMHTLTGAAVEAGSPIYTLADLSAVNVVVEVPERALPMLRGGQTADIQLAAYPTERIRGTVDRIREELDPTTRTVKAIVRVPNPRRILRPGMFASVRLESATGGGRVTRPVVPESAVIVDGAERYVFVEVAPRTFERRAVDVQSSGGGELIVHSGLAAGERVVTEGAFTLKSELAKGEFGGHDH